jgi:methylphosphotriester-DNA--protein-cysteine methyltransferase
VTDPEYRYERISTSDVETNADRAALWDDYLRTRQGSVKLAFQGDDFSSAASAQSVGQFQLVEFETAALDYQRSQRDVRGDGDNSYRLLIPLQGSFKFAQGDAKEVFHPGKIVFFHWGRPMYMTHEQTIRALIMTVPEKSIDLACADDAPFALDQTRPIVRLLETQIRHITDSREQWTTADFRAAFSSTMTLLEAALSPSGERTSGRRVIDAEHAHRLIEQHADDPAVTPETIAEMCGLSLRTLHTVLKEAGYPAPGAALRAIRVERARQRLATPLPVDMDRIAFEAGFTTTRRFRESFQRQFGQTPAQLREQLFGASGEG